MTSLVAEHGESMGAEDRAVEITLHGGDVRGGEVAFTVTSAATHGTLHQASRA